PVPPRSGIPSGCKSEGGLPCLPRGHAFFSLLIALVICRKGPLSFLALQPGHCFYVFQLIRSVVLHLQDKGLCLSLLIRGNPVLRNRYLYPGGRSPGLSLGHQRHPKHNCCHSSRCDPLKPFLHLLYSPFSLLQYSLSSRQ